MPRVHLFEWEDQQWFPKLFRDFITDHLAHMVSRLFIPAVPKLVELMQRTGHASFVDLCSGGGGPLFALVPLCSQALGKPVTATLTDLYPNLKALSKTKPLSEGAISYRTESTNAMDCPESLQGIRTLFTALHHFKPEDAKKILAEVVKKNVPIAAFESQERSIGKIIAVPIVLFLSAFLLTPFVGRMTMGRFLFTYLIPLAPLFYAWDGAISCLRTYNQRELRQLTESLTQNGYRWEIGQIPAIGVMGEYNITYLVGYPSHAEFAPAS
jgi:hypothetical protein